MHECGQKKNHSLSDDMLLDHSTRSMPDKKPDHRITQGIQPKILWRIDILKPPG